MDQVARSPVMAAIVLAAIIAEFVWRRRTRRGYDGGAALTTLGIALGNIALRALNVGLIAGIFASVWALVPHRLPADAWTSWAIGLLLVEFCYYWFHRASHRIRWLWASHSVHHSAEELTLLASLRLGWTSTLSLGWLIYLIPVALGLDPLIVGTLLAINLNFQFFLHSEAIGKLGPLEWVLNTPSHHRAHHACNPAFLDTNYGGILIVWDRLFGTLAPANETEKIYGLAGRLPERNPIKLALREWVYLARDVRAAPNWRGRLRAAVAMPSMHHPAGD